MPSLFTHLLIAEDAMRQVPDPDLRALLQSQSHYFFLGNLAPDFPYYEVMVQYRGLRLGGALCAMSHFVEDKLMAWLARVPAKDPQHWSERWHEGAAAGWIYLWLSWVPSLQDLAQRQVALAAFLSGMLCHIAADEALHPAIEVETGDQSKLQNRLAHRQLEVNLDYLYLQTKGFSVEPTLPSDLMARWLAAGPRQRELFFPAWLEEGWVELSRKAGVPFISPRQIRTWVEGFCRGLALLDHPFSPMAEGKQSFLQAQSAPGAWPQRLISGGYLSQHIPRAVEHCVACLEGAWEKVFQIPARSRRPEAAYPLPAKSLRPFLEPAGLP